MLMQNHFINEISGDSYWVRFVFRVPPSLSYGDSPVRLPAVHNLAGREFERRTCTFSAVIRQCIPAVKQRHDREKNTNTTFAD